MPRSAEQARGPTTIPPSNSTPYLAQLGKPTLVEPASFQASAETGPHVTAPHANDDPLAGIKELSVDVLVEQVLARNPSLAQMVAAWQAASARYPQVTSLEDPMLTGKLGPGSFGSNNVDFAYMVEVAQKLPFPGKRGLRGQSAMAETHAAELDVADMRL